VKYNAIWLETILTLDLVGNNTVRQDDRTFEPTKNATCALGAIGANGTVLQRHGVEL